MLNPAGFNFEKLYLVLPFLLKSHTVSDIFPSLSQTHSDSDWIPFSLSLQLVKCAAAHQSPLPQITALSQLFVVGPSPVADTDCKGICHSSALLSHPTLLVLGCSAFCGPQICPLGQGTLDMDTLWHSLLSTHRSETDPLVQAFSLLGCSITMKEPECAFFSLWSSPAVNSYSSDFCAICNCILSQPESSVSSISLVSSRQTFHVTHSPWNTFYQHLLCIGISSLTLCDSFRPSVKSADDFLTTVF